MVRLIDMVTEAALRTGMLGELTAVGSREALQRSVLWERLLLVAYAYGTNTGVSWSSVTATGTQGGGAGTPARDDREVGHAIRRGGSAG